MTIKIFTSSLKNVKSKIGKDLEKDIEVIKPSSKNYSSQSRFIWWDKNSAWVNTCFINVGKNLVSKIPNASTPFEYFANKLWSSLC